MERSLDHIVRPSDERTFSVDQVIKIINEAEALQRFDKDVHDEHRLHLEGSLATTPMSYDDLTTLANKMGVAERYTQIVLNRQYATAEQQKNDLRLLGSHVDPSLASRMIFDVVLEGYKRTFHHAYQQAFPAQQETLKIEEVADYKSIFECHIESSYDVIRYAQTVSTSMVKPGLVAQIFGTTMPKIRTRKNTCKAKVANFGFNHYARCCHLNLYDAAFTKIIAAPLVAFREELKKYSWDNLEVTHHYVPGTTIDDLKL